MPNVTTLLDVWTTELGQALEMMTGETFRISTAPVRTSEPGVDLWWEQLFSLAPNAVLTVGADSRSWNELGTRVLKAAGIELAEISEARNTWIELLQQTFSGTARSLGTKLGKTVECREGRQCAEPAAGRMFQVTLAHGDEEEAWLTVVVSAELVSALEADSSERPTAAPYRVPAPPQAAPPTLRAMDVLLDVHLPVSICFGQSSLPLKEVLKLTTGSVVELNRQPEEPVEVIVNDCVIARGEVVVVDGNYAVRIQEIISRQQRLGLRDGERAVTRS